MLSAAECSAGVLKERLPPLRGRTSAMTRGGRAWVGDSGGWVVGSGWFFSLVSFRLFVCRWSWGRHSLPGSGAARLVWWRGFELGSLMRRGTPPRGRVPLRQRSFRPVLGTGPARWRRSWARVSHSALGLRGAGVRPSRDHDGRVPGGRSDLALLRCHVTKGRHALHA